MEEENEKPNPQQEAFCKFFTTIGIEEFCNGTRSAIAAGYSEKTAAQQASRLLRNVKVQKRLAELHKENMERNNVTVDSVMANIEHDRILARQHKQIASAVKCDELEGKYLDMFRETGTEQEPHRQLTPEEEAIARKVAEELTKPKAQQGKPSIVKVHKADAS